jgi:hypothetical protein
LAFDGGHSSHRYVGLSTDSNYTASEIEQRVAAAAAAGTTRLHVFTDVVPDSWVAPLQAFLRG